VARALALGATAAGIARPVLRAFSSGGRAGAIAFLDAVEDELRAVMLLTGARDVSALRTTPRVVVGELAAWVSQIE
jgi:isopentenyl-diphosphate delta-isomerase